MTVLRGGGQGFYEDIMENLVLKNVPMGPKIVYKIAWRHIWTTPKAFPPNKTNFNSPANARNVGYKAPQIDVKKLFHDPKFNTFSDNNSRL